MDVILSVVGDGVLKERLPTLSENLGLTDRVHFEGAIAWGESLFEVMRKHDVLVLPSMTEGLPLVLIEAMSQGLPVVASNVGGVPEIVIHERTGLLVPPMDVGALYSAIERILDDVQLRIRCIEEGRSMAAVNTLQAQMGKISEAVVALMHVHSLADRETAAVSSR
jgi:glycosyltransferase involved in cell wall biosynthesis